MAAVEFGVIFFRSVAYFDSETLFKVRVLFSKVFLISILAECDDTLLFDDSLLLGLRLSGFPVAKPFDGNVSRKEILCETFSFPKL